MKLDKNGYQIEKRGSYATAVRVLTLIFGVGVVIVAVCLYAIFSGCGGGGSDSGSPIYDDAGVCVKNCSQDECPPCGYFEYIDGKKICMLNNCVNNEDGWVAVADSYYPSVDSCNGDTCAAKHDYIAPPCKVPTDPEIKKICMPLEAKKAQCIFYDYTTDSNPDCDLSKTDHCWCSGWLYDQDDCSSQAQCQKVPCEDWPPEVCWEFCEFAGNWTQSCCPGMWTTSTMSIALEGDGKGNCRLGEYIGKPGSATISYTTDDYSSELYFGDYCVAPLSTEIAICSTDGKCPIENHCGFGECNPIQDDYCYSNEDCTGNPNYRICQGQWCSATGESCNLITSSGPDPCAMDFPCLPDSNYIIEKTCSKGQCSESVWTRQNE